MSLNKPCHFVLTERVFYELSYIKKYNVLVSRTLSAESRNWFSLFERNIQYNKME